MKGKKETSGFVLILVLLTLVICGTVLAAAARRSGQTALRAAEAQQELQARWGALSCRDTVLHRAEEILLEQERDAGETAAETRRLVTLGEMKFSLIVSDELAKANVNRLADLEEEAELAAQIGDLLADVGDPSWVRLRPAEIVQEEEQEGEEESEEEFPVRYASFDQVVAVGHPAQLVGSLEGEGSPVRRRLTLWGSGEVNVKRAEMPVLRTVLGGELTASQLIDLDGFRRSVDDFTLSDLFDNIHLSEEQVERVTPLVTERSECYSVWIVAEGRTRRWFRLYVTWPDEWADEPLKRSFVW